MQFTSDAQNRKNGIFLDYTAESQIFDCCHLARIILRVNTVSVFIDGWHRQIVTSCCDFDAGQMLQLESLCAHVTGSGDLLVLENVLEDQRFASNPLVLGPPCIRFYAGAPLIDAVGVRVGTLCAVDDQPRSFTVEQRKLLAQLTGLLATTLQVHRNRIERRAEVASEREGSGPEYSDAARMREMLYREVIETIPNAVATYDSEDRLILFNSAYKRFYATSAPAIRLGARFEEILRFGLERGQYAEAGDTHEEREAWLAGRLKARRDLNDCRLLQRLDDGRWLQVTEKRSTSGYLVGVRTDVTDLKNAEMEMRRQSEIDSLTGLATREVLWRRLGMAICGRRAPESRGFLLLLDIDHFKTINDTFGHDVGDKLLQLTAARVHTCVRGTDVVARLGGDEFAVLFSGVADEKDADRIVGKLHKALTEPIMLCGKTIKPSMSIGAARYPTDGRSVEELYKNADAALYKTKQAGRNGWNFFDSVMQQRLERRRALASHLREAIVRQELEVALQQQVSISSLQHVGFEALARWSLGGVAVSPAEFIEVAEEAGLALDVGAAILKRAITLFAQLIASGSDPGRLSVNVGMAQLLDVNLHSLVAENLRRHGLSPERLEIEVTESVLLDRNFEGVTDALKRLCKLGVGVALDDFGTGYASLAHLKQVPVTRLKIDSSFVQNMQTNEGDAAIVRAIVGLARSLGLGTVAEGVETSNQLQFLRECGCDVAQGYLIARPSSSISKLLSQIAHPLQTSSRTHSTS